MRRDYDVIVVGAGNAALAAGVSARDAGARKVVVLEKAALEHRGGNTFFSGGLFRVAFDDVEQVFRKEDQPGEFRASTSAAGHTCSQLARLSIFGR